MKRFITVHAVCALMLIFSAAFAPCAAFAYTELQDPASGDVLRSQAAPSEIPQLIPPFHWTYHSLAALFSAGLLDNEIVPGKSAFTPRQTAAMVVTALKHAENDIDKLGEAELSALRQLAIAYKPYFADAGYEYDAVHSGIETVAMRAGYAAEAPKELYKDISSAVNAFALELYRAAASEHGRRNIFISPYSVACAVAAAYSGARGITEEEIERVIHITPDMYDEFGSLIRETASSPESVTIGSANAVWHAKGETLLPEFVRDMQDVFGASLNPLNFKSNPESARNTINKWTDKRTEHKIKDIVPSGAVDKDTRLVLTNAVYFKAPWEEEFKPSESAPRPFWVDHERSVKVLTMSMTGDDIPYAETDGAEIVSLPYKGGRFSMIVLLPSARADFGEFEESLTPESVGSMLSALSSRKVHVFLPKFRQENGYDLAQVLSKMGMPSAFDPDAADFSGITGIDDIHIGNLFHKTYIDVTEEGTEAAAASAVIMMRTSLAHDTDSAVFRADRPFIYMIRDNRTGVILFIGRYMKP